MRQGAPGATSYFLGLRECLQDFPPPPGTSGRTRLILSMPRLCSVADLSASGGLVRLWRDRPARLRYPAPICTRRVQVEDFFSNLPLGPARSRARARHLGRKVSTFP
jgi:hypothetical protein